MEENTDVEMTDTAAVGSEAAVTGAECQVCFCSLLSPEIKTKKKKTEKAKKKKKMLCLMQIKSICKETFPSLQQQSPAESAAAAAAATSAA